MISKWLGAYMDITALSLRTKRMKAQTPVPPTDASSEAVQVLALSPNLNPLPPQAHKELCTLDVDCCTAASPAWPVLSVPILIPVSLREHLNS